MTSANGTAIRRRGVAPHTPPATGRPLRPTGLGMTPIQRQSLQQLLFANSEPEHVLGEGIDPIRLPFDADEEGSR